MDKNPYDDTTIKWLPQSPIDRNKPITSQSSYPQGQQAYARAVPKTAPAKQKRMSKQKALEVVDFLKKGIVVTSVLSFGMFAWLAAGHNVGTTTSKTTSSGNTPTITTQSGSDNSSSTQSGSDDTSNTQSTNSSSSSSTQSNNGGFFNQGGGSSVGSSSSSSAVSTTSAS